MIDLVGRANEWVSGGDRVSGSGHQVTGEEVQSSPVH